MCSLEISQNSQKNTCVRVSFSIKLQASKKRLWHRCFPGHFAKFLRTHFLTERVWAASVCLNLITDNLFKIWNSTWCIYEIFSDCNFNAASHALFESFPLTFGTNWSGKSFTEDSVFFQNKSGTNSLSFKFVICFLWDLFRNRKLSFVFQIFDWYV